MNTLPVIDKYAARLLMVSFFLPMQLQTWAVMATGVYFISRTFITKQPIPRSNYALALLLSSIYLLYLFSIPMTPPGYKAVLYTLCQRKSSLLLMPFVFAIITPSFGALIRKELMYFVYGSLVACIIGNGAFIYQYCFTGGMGALSHVKYRIIFETTTGIHPTYMGMYLCFSICILLLSPALNKTTTLIIRYALLYLLLVFLLALLAKSPVIALILIFMHYGYLRRSSFFKHKMLLAGLLAVVAAACIFIPFISQRVGEMLSFFASRKPGNIADNSVYMRTLIWNTDTAMLKHYWLTGTGPGSMLQLLHERYFFYSLANHYNAGYYDPHNEYLSEWLSFGAIGILVLITVLVIHFIRAIRAKDNLYSYLLFILCITFFTETVLSRQHGVLFYAVFTSLFFFYPKSKER